MPDQRKYAGKLEGKKVLVIGGSAGIGFAVAEASLENGCKVVITSSRQEKVNTVVSNLQASYPSLKDNISGHAIDLADQANLDTNIKALLDKAGSGIDHIIFTAGDPLSVVPISEVTMALIQKAGTIRFFAPMFVAKHAPAYMNSGSQSSIILTTGSVSEKPRPNWAVVGGYATGLQGLCRGLALDLKPLRVNLVSPGAVDTTLWDHMSEEQKAKMFGELAGKLPTGKVARPDELAETYLYLMKDGNVTGTMVSSNGGALLI